MKPLIILDRDGVLNPLVVDPEQGTIDSPLHPSQVQIFKWVPQALLQLNQLGFDLAIATNQPAAAKGKTTHKNLEAVHEEILRQCLAQGAELLRSQICFHRSEDQCSCRKPKTGLLAAAFQGRPDSLKTQSWMVGDGVTDVQAGSSFGLRTAFFGPRKCDACKIFESGALEPDFWGADLRDFTGFLSNSLAQ